MQTVKLPVPCLPIWSLFVETNFVAKTNRIGRGCRRLLWQCVAGTRRRISSRLNGHLDLSNQSACQPLRWPPAGLLSEVQCCWPLPRSYPVVLFAAIHRFVLQYTCSILLTIVDAARLNKQNRLLSSSFLPASNSDSAVLFSQYIYPSLPWF